VLAGVARAASLLLDQEQQHVDVAVVARFPYPLPVARGLALAPVLLAAAAPEPHPSGVERAAKGLLVHPPDHEHLVGALLLDDRGNQAVRFVPDGGQLGVRRADRRGDGLHEQASVPATADDPSARIRHVHHLPEPPRAPARPVTLRHNEDVRVDPWFWLRERDNPAVRAYLEAENAYTQAALAHLADLRDRLYAEIVGRVRQTDASAPVRRGEFEYFVRTIEGRQYDVHCRRPAGTPTPPDPDAPPDQTPGETIVLDENELARGHEYFVVGDLEPSPGQAIAAYTTDTTGGERYTLRFRTLDTGTDLDDVVPDVYYGLAWADDDRTIFYTRPDQVMRPWQVWRHEVGTPATSDLRVYQEDDERFFVSVARARTGRLVLITAASKVTTEVWLVDASTAMAPARLVEPRVQGHEYHVEHYEGASGSRLFILTNADGAENFALVTAPVDAPGRANWTPVLPHRAEVRLDDVDAFAGHVVVSERAEGIERLRVLRVAHSGEIGDNHVIATEEHVSSIWTGPNADFETAVLRYGYTSLVTPASSYDYNLDTREQRLVKRQPVEGYDPARYATCRLWATAPDGARVPISLVYRRDLPRHDANPLLLYGYGSYETSIDPSFSSARVSLLDRGVVYAIAHVRGGGELGRQWYENGKLLHKPNTFGDFIAAAEHLVAEGWTAPDRLAARGGSAGGLLMGAVLNQRPDLFRAVVAEVPFVDVLTTILDERLPLTITEWEEWGDPVRDPELYMLMKSYSPYDNVEPKDYPALLVTAGLNDPRVQYWEPAKWVAKLRATKTDDNLLVLKMELGAGHSGPSGRYDAWRDEAFVQAFLLDQLGIRE
jgi:oligopeptidase B